MKKKTTTTPFIVLFSWTIGSLGSMCQVTWY